MGISDDIKPKRSYRYVEKKTVKIATDTPQYHKIVDSPVNNNPTESKPKDSFETKTTLEDDFFNAKKEVQKERKTKKSGKPLGPRVARKLAWVLVLLIVALAIYKNIDPIKNLFSKEVISTNTEENESTYTSTIDEQSTNTALPGQTDSKPAPEATSIPTLSENNIIKSSIRLEVLNGNGIRGSADKVSSLLTESGFKVDKVANAKKFAYNNTVIYYKTGKENAAVLIESVLSSYSCEKTLSDTLTSGYDIVVVVGKN